jgi:hypothetical protein
VSFVLYSFSTSLFFSNLVTYSIMAEAASSAIGIISFGLTVCKGLYEYYHAYKGFDSSISSAFESIAQVASTMVLLKDSCDDPGLDRERRDRVAACVFGCEGDLKRLSEKLQRLKIKGPEGFQGKTKAQFKRHAFPFKEQSLKELRNSADEAQSRLAFALQILELTERLKSQRVLDYLEAWSSDVSITIDEISDNTKQLLSFARSEEIDKIKNWLSPPDPWTNHHPARHLHQAETGKWVLENDAYKAWLGGSTRHLWLHGKAGCGKTVLSSTMVENVLHHCRQAVDFGFAPFYFTFSDKAKQTYEALLRSLVAQFGTQEPGLAIMREKYDQRHNLKGGLSIESLQPLLLDVLDVYDTAFVVLDALDECPGRVPCRLRCLFGTFQAFRRPRVLVEGSSQSQDLDDKSRQSRYSPLHAPLARRAVANSRACGRQRHIQIRCGTTVQGSLLHKAESQIAG